MSSSHSAAILVSLQSHHGPPFLAPRARGPRADPSARRRSRTYEQLLSASSRRCHRRPRRSGPGAGRRTRASPRGADAGGVRPVLEGRRSSVPSSQPLIRGRPIGPRRAKATSSWERARTEIVSSCTARSRRSMASGPPPSRGPSRPCAAEGDSSRLAGAQCELWFEHLYLLLGHEPSVPGRRPPCPGQPALLGLVTGRCLGARLGVMQDPGYVPRIPASTGALIFDTSSRLLILKPTYKSGWTIPGGQVEAKGETPWEACRAQRPEKRAGLSSGASSSASTSSARAPGRPGGMRLLFDCGALDSEQLSRFAYSLRR